MSSKSASPAQSSRLSSASSASSARADVVAAELGIGPLLREVQECAQACAVSASARSRAPSIAYSLANSLRNERARSRRPPAPADRRVIAGELKALGRVVFDAADFPGAQQIYRAAATVDPCDARALGNVASCCMNIIDYEGCEVACKTAEDILVNGVAEQQRRGLTREQRISCLAEDDRLYLAKLMGRRCRAQIKLGKLGEATDLLRIISRLDYRELPQLSALLAQGFQLFDSAPPSNSSSRCHSDRGQSPGSCGSDAVPCLCETGSDESAGGAHDDARLSSDLEGKECRQDEEDDEDEPPPLCASEDNTSEDEDASLPASHSASSVPPLEASSDEGVADPSAEPGDRDEYADVPGLLDSSDNAPADTVDLTFGDETDEDAQDFGFRPGFLNFPTSRASPFPVLHGGSREAEELSDRGDAGSVSGDSCDGDTEGGSGMPGLAEGDSESESERESDQPSEPVRARGDERMTVRDGMRGSNSSGLQTMSPPLTFPSLATGRVPGRPDVLNRSNEPARVPDGSGADDVPGLQASESSLSGSSSETFSDSPNRDSRPDRSSSYMGPMAMPHLGSAYEPYDSDESTQSLRGFSDNTVLEEVKARESASWGESSLREFCASVLGNSFPTQRLIDFQRFFGPHLPMSGVKRKAGRGNKKGEPCAPRCTQCWARRMFRSRFPWARTSKGPLGFGGDVEAVPKGMSEETTRSFLADGGFGSGRELYLSDLSAFVHVVCYISLLQCEVAWRDGKCVPVTRDIQNVVFQKLQGEVGKLKRFPGELQVLLTTILESVDDAILNLRSPSQTPRELDCRASCVASQVAELVGAPYVSKSAIDPPGQGRLDEKSDLFLYSNAAAWARVGVLKREEHMVFKSFYRDINGLMYAFYSNSDAFPRILAVALGDGDDFLRLGFLRVGRRSLFERSKFLENEVGDIAVSPLERSGQIVIGGGRQKAFARSEKVVADLRAATSSVSSDSARSVEDAAHARSAELLVEACERQTMRAKPALMASKRYLRVGDLKEACIFLAKGHTALTKRQGRKGRIPDADARQVRSEIYVLTGLAHSERMASETDLKKKRAIAEDAIDQFNRALEYAGGRQVEYVRRMLGMMLVLMHDLEREMEVERYCDDSDIKAPALAADTDASSGREVRQPGSLPVSSGPGIKQAADEEEALYMRELECIFPMCDQETRKIRKTDTWAEVTCGLGCVAVFHKKCYRSYSRAAKSSRSCPVCQSEPVLLPGLLMTAETAEVMRSKRRVVPRASPRPSETQSGKQPARENCDEFGSFDQPSSATSQSISLANRLAARGSGPGVASGKASSSKDYSQANSRDIADCVGSETSPASNARVATGGKKSEVSRAVVVPDCSVCNKTFNSLKQYEVHVQSARHLDKVAARERKDRMNVRGTRTDIRGFTGELMGGERLRSPGVGVRDDLGSGQHTGGGRRSGGKIARNPSFSLNAAIMCVKRALLTFSQGRAPVNILAARLDMRAFSVDDPAAYFQQHFDGLLHFCEKQNRVFKLTYPNAFNFAVVSLRNFRESGHAAGSSGSSAAAERRPVSPSSRVATVQTTATPGILRDENEFPSLASSMTGGHFPPTADFVSGAFSASRPSPSSSRASKVRDDLEPTKFLYCSGPLNSQQAGRPEGFISVGERNEAMCCICEGRIPDKILIPCGHDEFCSVCLSDWFSRIKAMPAKFIGKCPKCQQYVESLRDVELGES